VALNLLFPFHSLDACLGEQEIFAPGIFLAFLEKARSFKVPNTDCTSDVFTHKLRNNIRVS
jgi:hypothetical protein